MYHLHAHRSLLALLLGLTLLLTSCGSNASGPTAQATATTQAPATPQATASPQATPTDAPAPTTCDPVASGTFPVGVYDDASGYFPFSIEFRPNGQHFVNGGFEDCYLVSQQDIQFFDKNFGGCDDTATRYGDYTWAVDGTALRLTRVQDHCFTRSAVLLNGHWTKQQGG